MIESWEEDGMISRGLMAARTQPGSVQGIVEAQSEREQKQSDTPSSCSS
jgi:hypothetical protein